jgi:hypothetical protein
MRMIGRGPSAHALKFLHADMNFLHTDIVAEVGHAVRCHDGPVGLLFLLIRKGCCRIGTMTATCF